jgi:hypothetical protein
VCTIETFNLGTQSDTIIYLYRGSTLLASDDDSGVGLGSLIVHTLPANTTYYVRMRDFGSPTFGDNTRYDVRVDCPGGFVPPDQYEVDNSRANAKVIATNGTPQANHNFHTAYDIDWIKFSATAGAQCRIETFNLGPISDTVIELYRGSPVLAYDDNSGGELYASLIIYTMPATGNYFVKIWHGLGLFDSWTNYDVKVLCGVVPDQYEDDDVKANARVIATDGTPQANHNFHDAGDIDWIRFRVNSIGVCHLGTLNLGPNSDTVIDLFRGSTLLASDDDSGPGLGSWIDYPIVFTSSDYFVRIRQQYGNIFGAGTNYDVVVSCS